MKKYFILLFSLFFLVSFILLSKYEDRTILRSIDFATSVKIQERIDTSSHLRFASFVGNLMEGATFFASPEFTVVITLLLTGVALYDRKKKLWNVRALIIPLALVLLVGTEVYSKSSVHHPSPPFSMIKHPTSVFPSDYINDQFSYPSGHAARAVFLAVLSYFFIKKRLLVALGLGAYVALVSISRIYLGHHWFSDVLGGALLGIGIGLSIVGIVGGEVRRDIKKV